MEREEQQQQRRWERGARSVSPDPDPDQPTMRLSVTSTTGSPVELTVPRGDTVEGLRTRIAQNLRLHTDKIVLLHNNTKLTGGKLLDFGLTDGSKVTLVPVIEAGLVCSTSRPQRTVMDVLESLTEVQIDDFLSGRSPLNINLGIGAHVMYVQLQLSAQDVEELQQDGGERVGSRPDSGWIASTGAATSDSPSSSTSAPVCACPVQPSSPSHPAGPAFQSAHVAPAVNRRQSPPHRTCQTCPSRPPAPPLTSGGPAPVCSAAPSGSCPGPPSPTPASTFINQSNTHVPPPAQLCKQPGAIIESLVNHSPGVFSGTFSGALAPCSQTSVSRPQRGIAVILQILNDLLKAACSHQGAPPTCPQGHSPALDLPVGPGLASKGSSRPRRKPVVTQRAEHSDKASGEGGHHLRSSTEENKTLHCKLERLQFLLHQRRLHRRTRRASHLQPSPHPYQSHLYRP